MPLLKITKKEYEALYQEALSFFKKHNISSPDLHETIQTSVEIYLMRRYWKMDVTLEEAVTEVTSYKDACDNSNRPISYAKHISETPKDTDVEARRDLDSLYLIAENTLTHQEKLIFCRLVQDQNLEQICAEIGVELIEAVSIYESLIGKLRHAVTSSKDQKSRSVKFVGNVREKVRTIN